MIDSYHMYIVTLHKCSNMSKQIWASTPYIQWYLFISMDQSHMPMATWLFVPLSVQLFSRFFVMVLRYADDG